MKSIDRRVVELEKRHAGGVDYSQFTDDELLERIQELKVKLAEHFTPSCGWDAPMSEWMGCLRQEAGV